MSVFVGLMSGTSVDGISAAVVRFTPREAGVDPELLAFQTVAYSTERRDRLLHAMVDGTAQEYCRLAFDLGEWLAEAAVAAIAESGVARSEIRAIGSHGHTIWHEVPRPNEPPHSTWQLGEAAVIAERTGIDVVSDFRVRDVAARGQGAPLVPIADAMIFSGDDWRALQNIGGIGNVTVVPPGGQLDGVRAFDTGPGVAVIDAVTRRFFPDLSFDVDGNVAASGRAIDSVVDHALAHPYFSSPPPKSTGRELFNAAFVDDFVNRCKDARPGVSNADVVATATSLTARSIADAYRRFMPEPVREVLVSGGGAKNPTLVRMIADLVAPMEVRQFAERFFDGEAKEAVAFALLAYLHVNGLPGNVPRATGAKGPRVLGKLSPK
jgi:anhydro-N-acetylmuramic acid kinase